MQIQHLDSDVQKANLKIQLPYLEVNGLQQQQQQQEEEEENEAEYPIDKNVEWRYAFMYFSSYRMMMGSEIGINSLSSSSFPQSDLTDC